MAQTTISRIGIDVNLPAGASHDLLLVKTPDGYPVGQLLFEFETTPRKITGVQKVAQFFLKVLFTQKGTDLIHKTLGTNFPNLCIGANRVKNDPTFSSNVAAAIKDAESQTKYLLGGLNLDPASQLSGIQILGLNSPSVESLEIFLQLTTKAGETASIAVPFPEMDLKLSGQ